MSFIPATVLIIESHPLMREALCFVFAEEADLIAGMQAATIKEAMQMMQTILPEVILLSLGHNDPGEMEELATLSRLLPNIPILVLTSDEEIGQDEIAPDLGAQAVLSKAVSRSRLLTILREIRKREIEDPSTSSVQQHAEEICVD